MTDGFHFMTDEIHFMTDPTLFGFDLARSKSLAE
jgi:hypothetical protein